MSGVTLITGCSSGIGLSTAVKMAGSGYTVVATMRNTSKSDPLTEAAAAAGVELEVRELDVTDSAQIESCVSGVIADHGGIDVLVNNAGFGLVGSIEQIEMDAVRSVMEANFFGVWELTKAVLPGMRERGSGYLVTVTSVGGVIGQPFNEAYCAAKFAVEGMMEGLAPITRQFGVHTVLIEPGPVHTSFVDSVREVSAPVLGADHGIYSTLLQRYFGSASGVFAEHGQSGDDIADVILEAVGAEQPHLRYATSDYAKGFVGMKLADLTGDNIVDLFADRLAE